MPVTSKEKEFVMVAGHRWPSVLPCSRSYHPNAVPFNVLQIEIKIINSSSI